MKIHYELCPLLGSSYNAGRAKPDAVVPRLRLQREGQFFSTCLTEMKFHGRGRELQYRVEVQNRVYRREMAQLELELARLEKQLAQEPVEPSHASSSASIPQRNPSIGGGLPLLLLSVLPPVIPRASWPSADPSGESDSSPLVLGHIRCANKSTRRVRSKLARLFAAHLFSFPFTLTDSVLSRISDGLSGRAAKDEAPL